MHWRRKWQPTPVFLPGESQGQGSLVGCRLCGRTESDTTEATWQQQQQHTMTLVLSAGFPPFLILIHSFPSKLHIYTHLCTSAPYICPSQLLSQLCLFSPTYHSSIQTQLCVLIWKSFIPINYLVNSDSSLKTEVFLGSKAAPDISSFVLKLATYTYFYWNIYHVTLRLFLSFSPIPNS